MKKLLKNILLMLILTSLICSAEQTTIIIDEIIENDTVHAIVNTTIENKTISNSDFEKLIDYTIKLEEIAVVLTKKNQYLDALVNSTQTDKNTIGNALITSNDVQTQLLNKLDAQDKKYTVQIENLEQDIVELRQAVYKEKVKKALDILIISIILTLLITIIIHFNRSRRWYFIIRWIRERIPIQF